MQLHSVSEPTRKDHEEAELGRLAVILTCFGIALASLALHGERSVGTADAPFPVVAHLDPADGH